VIIAAGLKGVEGKYILTDNDSPEALPTSLDEAIKAMESSELRSPDAGESVFEYVLRNKRAEWNEYRKPGQRLRASIRYLPDPLRLI
jgi:glutamine synthetase